MPRLPPRPDIEWTPDGAPRSATFGDVYFSRAGGLDEAEAVFLRGCGLPEAWAGRARFTIVELGFGTGLNALATWRLWSRARAAGAILHFISVEAFPLAVEDSERAHAAFPELEEFARRLRDSWPVRAAPPQRVWLDEGFALTLIQQDAHRALSHLVCDADAWFLDGFSPACNPAMWNAELMRLIAQRSAPGARVATYSVAGDVRRALEAAGFAVEKKPGFGAKRERLEARLERAPERAALLFPTEPTQGRAAIIGGGIAGACLAHALKRRGRDCTIYNAESPAAAQAALVMPRLDRGGDIAEVYLASFIHAARLYEELGAFERCGVLELSGAREEALADLLADPPLPPDWFSAQGDGALHARAGLVRTREAISALTETCDARDANVASIAREGEFWILRDAAGAIIAEAEAVVLAAGARLKRFAQADWLPMRLSRGQIEWAPGGSLETALIAGTYAAPFEQGVLFGSTFDDAVSDDAPYPDEEPRKRNLAALARLSPEVARAVQDERMVSYAGLRATFPDYAPVLGLMPDSPRWRAQNADIAYGRAPPPLKAPSLKGLYVFGGLGARGFTLAPLLAECLASEICGEPPPLSRRALDSIHPARFLLRALKKREGFSS